MTALLNKTLAFYHNLRSVASEIPTFMQGADAKMKAMAEVGTEAHAILAVIERAQVFALDQETDILLTSMARNAREDGVEGIFWNTPLPFDNIWLERGLPEGKRDAFIIERQGNMQSCTTVMAEGDFLAPALVTTVTRTDSRQMDYRKSRYSDFAAAYSPPGEAEKWSVLQAEQRDIIPFGILEAKMMASLMSHPGMIRASEPVPAATRQERRRAQREGRSLPAKTVSHITLGEYGKGQLLAMTDERRGEGQPRRSHWVRGHWMRNRAGGVSWRMPHMRGVGPLTPKERMVGSDPDTGLPDLGI
jgi:hypothetical protein